jgi:hypothetical protein
MIALAATCVLLGSGAFTAPPRACTPGTYRHLTRAAVCVHHDRPTLHAADRRTILARYGRTTWTGNDGELDHRVPFFLGGLTDPSNEWPEPGSLPNPKDRLEFYVYRRVCDGKPHAMRVRTARRVFLHDWRVAYRRYIR